MKDVEMSELKLKTLDILCGELCAAMLNDEHGDGVDIASGMYGEETTIWIKSVASKHDKLTEQNKMLREALSLVVDKMPAYQGVMGGGYMMIVLSDDDCRIIKETLNTSEL